MNFMRFMSKKKKTTFKFTHPKGMSKKARARAEKTILAALAKKGVK